MFKVKRIKNWLAEQRKKKGNKFMTGRFMISIWLIVGAIVIVAGIVVCIRKYFSGINSEKRSGKYEVDQDSAQKLNTEQISASKLEKIEYENQLFEISLKIVPLMSGDTGLQELKERILDGEKRGVYVENRKEMYQEKKQKASKFIEDYRAVLKQADNNGVDVFDRLKKVWNLYDELLAFEPYENRNKKEGEDGK